MQDAPEEASIVDELMTTAVVSSIQESQLSEPPSPDPEAQLTTPLNTLPDGDSAEISTPLDGPHDHHSALQSEVATSGIALPTAEELTVAYKVAREPSIPSAPVIKAQDKIVGSSLVTSRKDV